MALEPIYGKGISLASGFDLGAKSPLDSRSIVNTIEERDAHVTGNRAYPGMKVYVLEEQKEYRYTGSDWKELDVVDLSSVHKHENKDVLDSITAEDISNWNAKSEFSGSYLDLSDLPKIPSKVSDLSNDLSFATESFVTNKIAEAKLEQSEIDLSGFATKDDIKNINLDLAANYATLAYVDEQISTHDHNVISDDEIIQEINKY